METKQMPSLGVDFDPTYSDDGTDRILTPEDVAMLQAMTGFDRQPTPPHGIAIRFLAVRPGEPTRWRTGYSITLGSLGNHLACGTYAYDPMEHKLYHNKYIYLSNEVSFDFDGLEGGPSHLVISPFQYSPGEVIECSIDDEEHVVQGYSVTLRNVGKENSYYSYIYVPTREALYPASSVKYIRSLSNDLFSEGKLKVPEEVTIYPRPQ